MNGTASSDPMPNGAGEIYAAAVKGRQDFRNAYRELLPVQRAAAALCLLWRTPGEAVGNDRFMEALNVLDVATCGGRRNSISKPILEQIAAAPASPIPPAGDVDGGIKVAGKSLVEWRDFARRDDCLERMVPSDLRQLISMIKVGGRHVS